MTITPKLFSSLPNVAGRFLSPDRTGVLSPAEAKTALQKLRRDFREAPPEKKNEAAAWGFLAMGALARYQRDYKRAAPMLEKAKTLFLSTQQDHGLALSLDQLACLHRETDRTALALECAHQAIELLRSQGQTRDLAWAYNNIAAIHAQRYERSESLSFAKKARALFTEFDVPLGLAWNACTFGRLYHDMGFFDKAQIQYDAALEAFGRLHQPLGTAAAWLGLGALHLARCRFDSARRFLEQALRVFEEAGQRDQAALCTLRLAEVARTTANGTDPVSLNKKARLATSGARLAWAVLQNGRLQRESGDLPEAWKTIQDAVALHADAGDRLGTATAENEWGRTYLALGDVAHARECFVRAQGLADQMDDGPLKAQTSVNLACLYVEEGALRKAVALWDEAAELAQRFEAREAAAEAELARAAHWLLIGETAKAREGVESARAIIATFDLGCLRPKLALHTAEVLVADGNAVEAFETLQRALRTADGRKDRLLRTRASLGLVQLLYQESVIAMTPPEWQRMEKEVRAIGSRKLKAQFLAVRALTQDGVEAARLFSQSADLLASAGLPVLRRQVLESAIERFRGTHRDRELGEFESQLRKLLATASPDLHLAQPRRDRFGLLPISLIA